ncbi:hypothetical protein [Microbispora sp. NBRC 16548]|uniref:hypothetical protein n=1 Tax=Microbispora sp. NBRC 16548 TaxID=3030994 RepID=UPI0024A4B777|nr:hypothetical protein [Microbispora sp. NBRC 16548]GLX08169.1 hypothetical protein Misp03_50950 [Microbispora sp. NBRC 16548]
MKRLNVLAVLFGVLAALFTGAGAAHAASSTDPVHALRQQFAAGRGVLVSETARTSILEDKQTYIRRTTGRIGFGKSGVVGYDLTSRGVISPGLRAALPPEELETTRTPFRAVNVGRYTYVQGFHWGPMPEGKTWVTFGKGNTSWQDYGQRGDQLIDVLSPARLKFVISKASSLRSGEYRGTLKTQNLYSEQGPMNPDRYTISFRLFVDKAGLPVRLITRYSSKEYDYTRDGEWVRNIHRNVVDTRYRWHANVKITAPPASAIVDFNDLPANRQPNFGIPLVIHPDDRVAAE